MKALLCLLLLVPVLPAVERTILPTEEAARQAAIAKAGELHARWTWVLPTHSMRPTIDDGWFYVHVATPYEQLKVGCIAEYRPRWAKGALICHRFVLKDHGGFIASGDNAPHSESWERVTAANYVSEVVAIYGWAK